MNDRVPWLEKISLSWKKAPIVWLSGVRRSGKTTLARMLPDALVLNCDLPSVAEQLSDPEAFYEGLSHRTVVFDEVHQIDDPSRLLKIAADAYPKLRILATGSSTLAATTKFRDTLTGRKRAIHLPPVLVEELPAFGIRDLKVRLQRGGLPQALLAVEPDPEFYVEWMDSFYARDIQELFRVEKRTGFLALLEGLLRQSGGLVEATSLAKLTGLSRPTVLSYLNVLETTHAIHVLRPFHGGGQQELVRQPKIYGFDTGFVCFARGWNELRTEDCGQLLEHVVLDTLNSLPNAPRVHYWRDKLQREVDFVLPRPGGAVDVVECKWSARNFETRGLAAFRALHPKGRNFVVSSQATGVTKKKLAGFDLLLARTQDLRTCLS